jgi:LysR family transcriptional regulator for bpeEF and oprC
LSIEVDNQREKRGITLNNKLQAMQVFVQVVDAGGFRRAADNMLLPKATVSKLIQSLEETLAVRLVHRTTRTISLTADGAAYYEQCVRILSEIREVEESLSQTRLLPSGRLRVSVPSGNVTKIIVQALPDFFARYPDIVLELGSSDRNVNLIEEGIDCAVRAGALPDSSLIGRRVAVMQFSTCATPAYLERHGRPQHPHDLSAHKCINYFSSMTGKTFDWDFTRNGERLQIAMAGSIALNDSNTYVDAGLAGIGIMQMADANLAPLIAQGLLEVVLEDWSTDPLPINIVYPQGRHLSAKVRVFVEWVAELFAHYPGMQPKSAPPSKQT